MNIINFHHVQNLQVDWASGGWIAEGWSTDSCRNFFGHMIVSDVRAFQSSLKVFFKSYFHQLHQMMIQRSKLWPFWSPWRVEKIFGGWISGESRQLGTYRLKEKFAWKIINNGANLINSTSGSITCLSLFPSRHSESGMHKLKWAAVQNGNLIDLKGFCTPLAMLPGLRASSFVMLK